MEEFVNLSILRLGFTYVYLYALLLREMHCRLVRA